MNLKRAGEVVHAQHRVPVAAERRHMKGTGDVDEQSLRTSISAAFGSIWHGVTSHPGLRALPTWMDCLSAKHSHQKGIKTFSSYRRITQRQVINE